MQSRQEHKLLLCYFLISFGSSMSMITTFIQINPYFGKMEFLAYALSARTLVMMAASLSLQRILQSFKVRNILFYSQLFGVISTISIMVGFSSNSYLLVFLGIVLGGLPANILNVCTTSTLKNMIMDEFIYRKISGTREIASGCALIGAGLLAPILSHLINIHYIFLFTAIVYLLTSIYILLSDMSFGELDEPEIASVNISLKSVFTSKPFILFQISVFASLILIGLFPIVAGTKDLIPNFEINDILRGNLWALEGVAVFSMGLVYIIANKVKHSPYVYLLFLNAVLIFLLTVFTSTFSLFLICFAFNFLMSMAFLKFKDDLLIIAGSNRNLVNSYTTLAHFIRSLLCTISPLLLTIMFGGLGFYKSIMYIFIYQLGLLILYIFINKFKS
jgi:MFS family permease